MMKPGNMIPAKRSPTETSATGARMMTSTEGGMIVPSDPPAQIVPEISDLL